MKTAVWRNIAISELILTGGFERLFSMVTGTTAQLWIEFLRSGAMKSGPTHWKLLTSQFGPVKVTALKDGGGEFKHPSFALFELKFLLALWHATGCLELSQLDSRSHLSFDHDPGSALGAGDTGAKNAVSHKQIIGRSKRFH